ncbi:hypothetical protein SAMN05216436_10738 [bacterium A37T11]|nr:hypothetical protein SAMN05216436_10738 [bacterium A37T11]
MNVKSIKKIFVLFMVFGIGAGILGCSKDDDVEPAKDEEYLTCKIDGEYREFNGNVNANDKPDGPVHFVVISGHETDDSNSPGFGIDLLVEDGEATTKKYTTANANLHGSYYEQTNNGTISYDAVGTDGTSFKLNITRLDDWGVSGTFSGVLKLGGSNTYITVTDGKFSAAYNGND